MFLDTSLETQVNLVSLDTFDIILSKFGGFFFAFVGFFALIIAIVFREKSSNK